MRVKISLIRLPQEQLWGKRKEKKNYDEQIPVNKDSESSKVGPGWGGGEKKRKERKKRKKKEVKGAATTLYTIKVF